MARRCHAPVMSDTLGGTLLLHPHLVPSDNWLRRGLFWNDRVATLVPGGSPTPVRLHELEALGVWTPRSVESLSHAALAQLTDEADEVLRMDPDLMLPVTGKGDPLLTGKLPYDIEAQLVSRGAVREAPAGSEHSLEANKNVLPILLALCGRYVADNDDTLTLGPASAEAARVAYAPLVETPSTTAWSIAIANLPEPASTASLYDIITFRAQHQQELQRYRESISNLVKEFEKKTVSEPSVKQVQLRVAINADELAEAAMQAALPLRRRARQMLVTQLPDDTAGSLRLVGGGGAAVLGTVITTSEIPQGGMTAGAAVMAVGLVAHLTAKLVGARARARAHAFPMAAYKSGLLVPRAVTPLSDLGRR